MAAQLAVFTWLLVEQLLDPAQRAPELPCIAPSPAKVEHGLQRHSDGVRRCSEAVAVARRFATVRDAGRILDTAGPASLAAWSIAIRQYPRLQVPSAPPTKFSKLIEFL